jgi:hypothetical protein
MFFKDKKVLFCEQKPFLRKKSFNKRIVWQHLVKFFVFVSANDEENEGFCLPRPKN